MKFVGIVGTNAEFSYNRMLLEFMADYYEEDTIEVLDIDRVPMFNETKDQTDAAPIQELKEKIEAADGVIIATPEHNHSIPSALKSVIEWLSYKIHPLDGKPVMIVGASYSVQGSSRSQLHLRQILDAPGVNAIVMPGNEFLLGRAHEAFDEDGKLKDKRTVQFLSSCFRKFKRFTEVAEILNQPEEVSFKPGDYHVSAVGHNGDLPMVVTFSEDRIEAIDIDTEGETEGIADLVFTRLPEEIIDGQTLNVDVVSGASVTSNGVVDGVADAVYQAGSDPEILKKRPKVSESMQLDPIEKTVDVAVIGSGGAGLAAAVAALDKGASALVLEKFPVIGGNTVRTGGQINAADPEWQHQFKAIHGERATLEKIYNTPEEEIAEEYREDFRALKEELDQYFKDLDEGKSYLFDSIHLHTIQTYIGGKRMDLDGNEIHSDIELIHYLTKNALPTIDWLKEKGVSFDEHMVAEPVGALWRRAREPQASEGFGYIDPLTTYIEEHGGEIMTDTKADRFIVEDGKIVGIQATGRYDQKVTIHVNKGVVIATGGFGANIEMIKKYDNYWGNLPESIPTTNSPALTGDGIEMGQEVGADVVGMGFVQLMPSADPITGNIFSGIDCPPSDFIFVNKEGKRFVDEYASRDVLAKALFDQGGVIYNISDAEIAKTRFNSTDEQLANDVKKGACFKADTLEDLAKQLDIDHEVFVKTIEDYNSYVDQGYDEEFQKGAFNHKVIVPPFYATPRSPATHHTMGGLKIDAQTRVLNTEGQAIQGLYAAGEVAGGVHAGNRLGGNALADIFVFGKLAGENAAE
ncbi:flavocytochrome c [Aerococcus sp. UMB7834]|uniref:flavocytochrome c n=1 Tax=Aerococcus sp. UMB7834 TaxID=3046342 RepID=UPI00254DB344|nr:flavocytochrome c [Aerococcus sp. UMB7834]MDK6804679.1 flavocytochrome c [Aerococcus sp. UMB7834]